MAVAVAVRLPHLLGGHVALDGDESIVGLMARDLLEGKRLPIFFYGQRYGLALRLDVVAGRHFVLESPPPSPPPELLRSLGFELAEPHAGQP